MLKTMTLALSALLAGQTALADEWGTLNPDEGGIRHIAQDLKTRPHMAGFRCWVVYETQKGGLHGDAFQALEHCAASGNAPSMILMSHAYENGLGVAQNHEVATFWAKQAALQNYPVGQFHYGMALLLGRGVPQDDGQARFWLDRAAQAGDRDAARALRMIPTS